MKKGPSESYRAFRMMLIGGLLAWNLALYLYHDWISGYRPTDERQRILGGELLRIRNQCMMIGTVGFIIGIVVEGVSDKIRRRRKENGTD